MTLLSSNTSARLHGLICLDLQTAVMGRGRPGNLAPKDPRRPGLVSDLCSAFTRNPPWPTSEPEPRALQRFGIEGCEALLPGLEALVERCAARGVRRLEMGMPHRGRLNVRLMLLVWGRGFGCVGARGQPGGTA